MSFKTHFVVSAAIAALAALACSQAHAQFSSVGVGTTAGDGTGDPLRTAFGKINANFLQTAAYPYLVTNYGAKCDGKPLTGLAMTSGSNVVTSTAYTFTSADVGKNLGIAGAGGVHGAYGLHQQRAGVIMSVSGGAASIGSAVGGTAINALTTVSGANGFEGTDDVVAFQNAVNAAAAAGGGTVVVPAGSCVIGSANGNANGITWASNVYLEGQGEFSSTLYWIAPVDMGTGIVSYYTQGSATAPLSNWGVSKIGMNGFYATDDTIGFNVAASGLRTRYNLNENVHDVYLTQFPATCIGTDYMSNGQITNNIVTWCGRLGGYTSGGSSGIGIAVGNSSGGTIANEGGIISGNYVQDATRFDIFIEAQNGNDSFAQYAITHNRIVNTQSLGVGISDAGGRGTTIANNVLSGIATSSATAGGIELDYGSYNTWNGNGALGAIPGVYGIISNNTVYGFGHCFNLAFLGTVSPRYKVKNNQCFSSYGSGYQISITAGTVKGVELSGNQAIAAGGPGIAIIGTGTGALSEITINDNTLMDNNANAATGPLAAGIYVSMTGTLSNFEARGNTLIDDSAGNEAIGLSIASGTTINGYNATNNNFRGVTTAITNSGTITNGQQVNNLGYNPIGTSAVTVTASPMTYTNGLSPSTLYVIGGTVTGITRNGTSIGTPSQVTLPPNASVVITYTTAPTLTVDQQ